MRLVTFSRGGAPRLGRVDGDRVVDLSLAAPELPKTMRALLAGGPSLLARAQAAAATPTGTHALSEVRLHAPVGDPPKFLAIGMNYRAHAEEARRAGLPIPTSQLWFNKQVGCVTGPFDDVWLPSDAASLDHEVELGVVIGAPCFRVSEKEATRFIAGYFVCNDFSVREWQARSPTFTLGKSFPTHGPTGPWLTTADEVPEPNALALRLTVNGEERQSASTADMIYRVFEQVAWLSAHTRLEPGDILSTGTPSGVGVARQPPLFLRVGDVVRAEVEGLGHLENRVVAEPAHGAAGTTEAGASPALTH